MKMNWTIKEHSTEPKVTLLADGILIVNIDLENVTEITIEPFKAGFLTKYKKCSVSYIEHRNETVRQARRRIKKSAKKTRQ
jgi:hypothetical protein